MDPRRDPITEALKIARRCGIGFDEFWVATPWMVGVAVAAEGERIEEEYRTALNVAWHGAAFQRSKKMPDLRKVMRRDRGPVKRPKVNEDRLISMMQAHNARVRQAKKDASPSETR